MEGRFSGGIARIAGCRPRLPISEPRLTDPPSGYSPAVNAHRSRIGPGAFTPSFHRTQVAVQPIKRLFDHFVPRNVMTRFVDHSALVFLRAAQKAEHRLLRCFYGVEEIKAAVQHQHWHFHVRSEV